MSVCACMGGPNCCRNKGEYQNLGGRLWRDVKEYWPNGQLKSWTLEPAAPDASRPLIPSPTETVTFKWRSS